MKLVYSKDFQSPAVHKYFLRNDEGADINLTGMFYGLFEDRSPDAKNWTRMSAYRAIDGTHYVKTETVSIINEMPFVGSESLHSYPSATAMVRSLPVCDLTSKLVTSLGIEKVQSSDNGAQGQQSQFQDHWQPYPFPPS